MVNAKATASQRVGRLLTIVPWIVSHPGERLTTIAARFDVSEKELLADLSTVSMVGLPPYTPDTLVDVVIDDEGRVTIYLADFFSKPLQLSPTQALALVASCEAMLSIDGDNANPSLANALEKIQRLVGSNDHGTVGISLGAADEKVLKIVSECIEQKSAAEISYHSYGRDEIRSRKILPQRVVADKGNWYVQAWCLEVDAERLFRIDRIESIAIAENKKSLDSVSVAPLETVFSPRPDSSTVTLRLNKKTMWVLESYPYIRAEPVKKKKDTFDVTLAITAEAWFDRVAMQLGTDVEILSSQGFDAKASVVAAADKILALYS